MGRIIIISFIYIFTVLSLSSCKDDIKEKWLNNVDIAIEDSAEAQKKAIKKAEALSRAASSAKSADEIYQINLTASDAWKPLDLEKSLEHLKTAVKIAANTSDSIYKINDAKIRLAQIYNSQGSMLKEASDIYESIDAKNLPDSLKTKFFILGVQLNRALSNRAFDKDKKQKYINTAASLRDSVLKFDSNSTIIAVNKLMEKGDFQQALIILRNNRPSKNPHAREMAPYYHYMSEVFAGLQQPDSQIYYLSLSSTTDLKNGVREYIALPQLAQILMNKDLKRAVNYINQSQRDAELSNSDLRQKEIAPVYREIHATNNTEQQQQKYLIFSVLVAISLVSFIIVTTLWSLRQKNRQLEEYSLVISNSKHELEVINEELKNLNANLKHESRVKEHYVRSFMELSLDYLSQMEKFRAEIAKTAAKKDWNTLTQRITSSRYLNSELRMFYDNFDQAFLSIYPNYREVLNSLLQPEFRYPELKGKLTTELRIYALICLGIMESAQIAKFLKCSESTVYNYRTKMRNKAIKREYFENDFKTKIDFS